MGVLARFYRIWRIFLDGMQFWPIIHTCFFFFTEAS